MEAPGLSLRPEGEHQPLRVTPLHRHQLALLTDAGWRRVLASAWDAQARDCLVHWAERRLPLVVTRQRPQEVAAVCLGLPAPCRWDRRRIALAVPYTCISHFDAFPAATRLPPLLASPQREPWRALCSALSAYGTSVRIYGSHGWQLLTGLEHLRTGSDIDLCISIDGPAQADAVAALLQSWPDHGPSLDGELVFDGGNAVAWREWLAWRAKRTPSLLVKRLDGMELLRAPFWREAEAV